MQRLEPEPESHCSVCFYSQIFQSAPVSLYFLSEDHLSLLFLFMSQFGAPLFSCHTSGPSQRWTCVSKFHNQILGKRLCLPLYGPNVCLSMMLVPTYMARTHLWRIGAITIRKGDLLAGLALHKDPNNLFILFENGNACPSYKPLFCYNSYAGSLEKDVQFAMFRKFSRWV